MHCRNDGVLVLIFLCLIFTRCVNTNNVDTITKSKLEDSFILKTGPYLLPLYFLLAIDDKKSESKHIRIKVNNRYLRIKQAIPDKSIIQNLLKKKIITAKDKIIYLEALTTTYDNESIMNEDYILEGVHNISIEKEGKKIFEGNFKIPSNCSEYIFVRRIAIENN